MTDERHRDPQLASARKSPSRLPSPARLPTLHGSAMQAITRLASAQTSEEAGEALEQARALLGDEEQVFMPLLQSLSLRVGELEQLRRLSTLDELTGVANLRAFNEALKREASRAQRTQQSYSIIMLDLDDLKIINDLHGHAVGDQAIRLVAETCLSGLRASDVLARLGGDEFAFLLPNTDFEGASCVAARVRAHIAQQNVQGLPLRACLGVATCSDWTLTTEDVVARADQALYQEKRKRPSARRERAA